METQLPPPFQSPRELPSTSSVAEPTPLRSVRIPPEPLYASDKVFAKLATLSYLKNRAVISCFKNNPTLAFFQTRYLKAFAFKCGEEAYIAFRGTNNCHNWVTDFNAIPVGWPLRHRGFQRSWDALKPKIHKWLAKHRPSVMFLTGHSLGSAIATVAAYELSQATIAGDAIDFSGTDTRNGSIKSLAWGIRGVIGFGGPKVGGLFFGHCYRKRQAGPASNETLDARTKTYVMISYRFHS
jgi:Lipase (class 3)